MVKYTFLTVSLLLVFSCQSKEANITYGKNLTPKEFKELLEKETSPQLIDVRTTEEFQTGALNGAVNISSSSLNFIKQIEKLDKNKPVFLYCLRGTRSQGAMNKLVTRGFTNVYSLDGGIKEWKERGFPITNGISKAKTGFSVQDFSTLLAKNEVVLVDFYAPWCGPCRAMEPSLEKLTKEFEGKVHIERINVDESTDLSRQMKISSIPLLVLYKNGKEFKRSLGLISEDEIRTIMKSGI